MDHILRGYHLNNETWLYLSLLLIVAVYFKFSRLWSVRNLDVILLLFVSPGLLLVRDPETAAIGYGWLFLATGLFLVRVLTDGLITRRPRLEQNMNAAGMAFLCASTVIFLTTKVMTDPPPSSAVESVRKANELIKGESPAPQTAATDEKSDPAPAGPATSLVALPVAQLSKVIASKNGEGEPTPEASNQVLDFAARIIAILSHLAVIWGLVLVGRSIFGDADLGFAMATLYMLLPCTAFDVGSVHYVLPAALVVWAIRAYRHPLVSGTLLGLACAMIFFPIFLLPLWVAFYGRRGGMRFGAAVILSTAVIMSVLLLVTNDSQTFVRQTLGGWISWTNLQFRAGDTLSGFWHDSAYRIPVFVAYLAMLVVLTVWPRQKSLSHVITHSAALIIGTQFWFPEQGGVFVLWYLPLLILVVFRPAMTNHFAPEIKPLAWLHRQRAEQRQPELTISAMSRLNGPVYR